MKNFFYSLALGVVFFVAQQCYGQHPRYDSTMKIGEAGYRVSCSNKKPDANELYVKPLGFDHEARGLGFFVKGYVKGCEVDDMNDDGYPDLLVYVYSGPDDAFGAVVAFGSDQNKKIVPFPLPDVVLNGKINEGYRGHDHFSLMEGSLLDKFPIYKQGDEKDKPTGGYRIVQYKMTSNGQGGFQFVMLRFYETR